MTASSLDERIRLYQELSDLALDRAASASSDQSRQDFLNISAGWRRMAAEAQEVKELFEKAAPNASGPDQAGPKQGEARDDQ